MIKTNNKKSYNQGFKKSHFKLAVDVTVAIFHIQSLACDSVVMAGFCKMICKNKGHVPLNSKMIY